MSCSNEPFQISKYLSHDLINLAIETGALSYIPIEVIDLIELAQDILKLLLGLLITLVFLIQIHGDFPNLPRLPFQTYHKLIILFNHLINLPKYFLKDFFLLSLHLCLLKVLVGLVLIVNLVKELLNVISQVVYLFFMVFDALNALA